MDCQDGVNADVFHLDVTGTNDDSISTLLTIRIEWDPTSGQNATNELALQVYKNGNLVGESDGGTSSEVVGLRNPAPGQYEVFACAFANTAPQPYKGQVSLNSTPRQAQSLPAASDARGLQFVTVDPQRDVAEPSLRIDKAGNIYECGPLGSSRAADYATKSEDNGETYRVLGEPPEGRIAPGGGGAARSPSLRRGTYRATIRSRTRASSRWPTSLREDQRPRTDEVGPIVIVTYSKQKSGLSLFASQGTVPADPRKIVRSASSDPRGDAEFDFSSLEPTPPRRENVPPLDLTSLEASSSSIGKKKAITFELKVDGDLGTDALLGAATDMNAAELKFMIRWFSAYRPDNIIANYDVATETFGFHEGHLEQTKCEQTADGRLEVYPAPPLNRGGPIPGRSTLRPERSP
ncbi:MAG TPA: hypothetical protein VJ827_12800 [Rubrobacter sp.]|nr:hypothetical protein [Rubrobacter sp.]